MIERSDCARLSLEALLPRRIAGDLGRQDLERNIPA
jgi:hypothetical protein